MKCIVSFGISLGTQKYKTTSLEESCLRISLPTEFRIGFHSVQPNEQILKVLSGCEAMGLQEGETDDNQDVGP